MLFANPNKASNCLSYMLSVFVVKIPLVTTIVTIGKPPLFSLIKVCTDYGLAKTFCGFNSCNAFNLHLHESFLLAVT